MAKEVEVIQKAIAQHMEDLHILFIDYDTTLDIEYYNKVHLALLKAEEEILEATTNHNIRVGIFKENFKLTD